MRKAFTWLAKTFQNSKGNPDGRAVTIFVSFLFMLVAGSANLFYDYEIDAFIFDAFYYIVLIGIGILSPELVSKIKAPTNKPKEEENKIAE